ncbi:hypothetical protein AGMMS50256_00290 [Betaproteobacteria bacterium]|nr:hypothetical protein AGMMS50256_00290 [Betaproteobacteria bacterium]
MLALAYQEEVTPLAGVWTGTIGKQAITACFNAGEYRKDKGSYYYQRYLQPIDLVSTDIKSGGIGTEWKESDGEWHLLLGEQPSDAIKGTWTNPDKSRTLPIMLTKVKEFDGEPIDDTDGCASDAYLKAIEPSPKTLFGPEQVINGVKYREVSVIIEGFEDRRMETIEVVGDTPAIQAINRQLREITPVSELASKLLGCWREFWGKGGQREQRAEVSVIGPWLMLRLENNADCVKGRSIEVWDDTYIWNLESGERENLLSWFQDENTTEPRSNVTLPTGLAEFIYDRIGTDDPTYDHFSLLEEFLRCYGDLSPEKYKYRLELFDGGIDFVVPTTSNGSCGDSFKIPFKELRPFLNEKGEAAVAQFRKFSAAKKR